MSEPTILLVDDNEPNRYAVSRMLQRAQMKVLEAGTGAEALSLASTHRPDLIILDINLPDITGFEVCRAIKSEKRTAAIPVIHLSATMIETEHKVQGLEGGAEVYLTHPFEPIILLASVKALLRLRHTETALRESEERFRLMVESASEFAIISLNTSGHTVSWNAAAERLLGWQEAEILGQSGEVIFTEEDRKRGIPEQEMETAARIGRAQDERWHVRKNGSRFWGSGTMSPLVDETGSPKGFVKIFRDMTERRQADEILAHHHAEIEALNARLRRAMAETHHRIKNSLQVIGALVDMQQIDAGETVPVSVLARIGQHVRTLAGIHDLLTQEAKNGAELDRISSKAILEKLIPLIATTLNGRRIRANVQDASISVTDGTALSLLVNELISNAVKHGSGEIELTMEITGDMARMEVCDDGPGFSVDFDPRVAANTGLELIESVVRWDLQGQATYENRTEGGARVTVTFPVHTVTDEENPA